jgi:hypothetical protein
MFFKTMLFECLVMFGVVLLALGERKLISVYYSTSYEEEIKSPMCIAEQLHNTMIICCPWDIIGSLRN